MQECGFLLGSCWHLGLSSPLCGFCLGVSLCLVRHFNFFLPKCFLPNLSFVFSCPNNVSVFMMNRSKDSCGVSWYCYFLPECIHLLWVRLEIKESDITCLWNLFLTVFVLATDWLCLSCSGLVFKFGRTEDLWQWWYSTFHQIPQSINTSFLCTLNYCCLFALSLFQLFQLFCNMFLYSSFATTEST